MNEVSNLFMTLLHSATSGHILHLQTRSFAQHMALDGFYKEMPDLVDDLIEAWQGKNGKIVDSYPSGYEAPKVTPLEFMESLSKYFQENRKYIGGDTELQNISDEIQGLFDSTLYKLRFLS